MFGVDMEAFSPRRRMLTWGRLPTGRIYGERRRLELWTSEGEFATRETGQITSCNVIY